MHPIDCDCLDCDGQYIPGTLLAKRRQRLNGARYRTALVRAMRRAVNGDGS